MLRACSGKVAFSASWLSFGARCLTRCASQYIMAAHVRNRLHAVSRQITSRCASRLTRCTKSSATLRKSLVIRLHASRLSRCAVCAVTLRRVRRLSRCASRLALRLRSSRFVRLRSSKLSPNTSPPARFSSAGELPSRNGLTSFTLVHRLCRCPARASMESRIATPADLVPGNSAQGTFSRRLRVCLLVRRRCRCRDTQSARASVPGRMGQGN